MGRSPASYKVTIISEIRPDSLRLYSRHVVVAWSCRHPRFVRSPRSFGSCLGAAEVAGYVSMTSTGGQRIGLQPEVAVGELKIV